MLTPSTEIQERIEVLRKNATDTLRLLQILDSSETQDVTRLALRYCIERTVDMTAGCLRVVELNLPVSSTTLARGLLESLFTIYWLVQSEENAANFTQASKNELKRLARAAINTGYAKVSDKTTGEDISQQFLKSEDMRDIPKRPEIAEMARISGLEKVYRTVYGYASMIVHGNFFGMATTEEMDDQILAALDVAISIVKAINTITITWQEQHKVLEASVVLQILNV